MKITKEQLEVFCRQLNTQINLYNVNARKVNEAADEQSFTYHSIRCDKYRHAVRELVDLMNVIDDDREYTIKFVDTGFFSRIDCKIKRR